MDTERKRLYVETTIPSYATAWTSHDLLTAAKQATTKLFWETARDAFELYVSNYVINECRNGDPGAAQRRLQWIEGIEILPETKEITALAAEYQALLDIPDTAKIDCFHLATCVVFEMDYLLSWNCTHLGDNYFVKVRGYNEERHLWTPLLVTPQFFLGQ
jgi:hypothetical protein